MTKAQLLSELGAQEARFTALTDGLAQLSAYLQSAKFAQDSTVQVRDVLTRMAEADRASTDAYFSAEPV